MHAGLVQVLVLGHCKDEVYCHHSQDMYKTTGPRRPLTKFIITSKLLVYACFIVRVLETRAIGTVGATIAVSLSVYRIASYAECATYFVQSLQSTQLLQSSQLSHPVQLWQLLLSLQSVQFRHPVQSIFWLANARSLSKLPRVASVRMQK